jgi:hypothetical protein
MSVDVNSHLDALFERQCHPLGGDLEIILTILQRQWRSDGSRPSERSQVVLIVDQLLMYVSAHNCSLCRWLCKCSYNSVSHVENAISPVAYLEIFFTTS